MPIDPRKMSRRDAIKTLAAGIVADSVPASEWQETQSKARAVLRAAEMARAGLNNPSRPG